jgi:hypothetical protein
VPFTGSHPAAVLPFLRWSMPASALVIGSMAPDFPGGRVPHRRRQLGRDRDSELNRFAAAGQAAGRNPTQVPAAATATTASAIAIRRVPSDPKRDSGRSQQEVLTVI